MGAGRLAEASGSLGSGQVSEGVTWTQDPEGELPRVPPAGALRCHGNVGKGTLQART